ncbi:MAG: hypothetical protein Q7J08_02300 [Methanocorpusculum sp.]|uniref:hypothetical protein n=1 Tax=Methanocorpusculum sp. TaxID=2058474 RepID=UPI00271594CC|nr:hypothetical protein [Methanocorpusculum sp.]MDO9522525.1 hypothetical protein [Methanocorpusculum sp.]
MFYFEIGVGATISIYGGMNIPGNQLTHVYQHPFVEDDNAGLEVSVITKLDNNRDPYHHKLTAAWFLSNTTEKSFNPLLFQK